MTPQEQAALDANDAKVVVERQAAALATKRRAASRYTQLGMPVPARFQ